ncbi:hypothetical protein NEPAR05_2515, partial [Nematocida parisii]
AVHVPAAPYPAARFTPPRACCLPARAHSPRCCARVCSSRPPSSALPRATPAGRLSCGTFRGEPATRPFDWSFAATPTSRDRFARQAPSELLPGLPPPSLAAGVVHRLSGRCARTLPAPLRRAAPAALRRPGVPPARAQRSLVRVSRRAAHRPAPHALRAACFAPFHSAPARLFSFPSRYFFSIGLPEYLAFDGPLHLSPCLPTHSYSLRARRVPLRGSHPLWPAFQRASRRAARTPPQVRRGLFPFRSLLLRKSVFVFSPPRTDMLKFRGSPHARRPFRHSRARACAPFRLPAAFLARIAQGSPGGALFYHLFACGSPFYFSSVLFFITCSPAAHERKPVSACANRQKSSPAAHERQKTP